MSNVIKMSSKREQLEDMSIGKLLHQINEEDKSVPNAVEKAIPAIEKLVEVIVAKLQTGGRLFYLGAGTSGRQGILDASECPAVFGIRNDKIIAIIAGGDRAIRQSAEFAEQNTMAAWKDLNDHRITPNDIVVGIDISGEIPYIMHGLKFSQENQITTACITCKTDASMKKYSDFPVEVVVGDEFVSGSVYMKAATALKLVLNMISASSIIKLGSMKDSKPIDMQLSNNKLIDRGVNMLTNALDIDPEHAKDALLQYGSVRRALLSFQTA